MFYSLPPHSSYISIYTALPPSTSKLIPVTNADSSDAKKRHADATSEASQSRPRGTFDKNFARFSGVLGTPVKDSNLQRATC